jgi:hypothetical protein
MDPNNMKLTLKNTSLEVAIKLAGGMHSNNITLYMGSGGKIKHLLVPKF